jgi:4-nitrophenyl phosphatase
MAEPQLHPDALLLDLDGVLFRGDQAIPGAAGLLEHLQATSTPFGILTNNSTRTPEEYVDKLAGIGVRLQPRQILTSALVAATRLAQERGPTQRVFVVGSDSLRDLLRRHDVTLTSDWTQATDVLVGLDRDLCYETMARASLAIGRGARFLGTNDDRSFPSERGFEPGAGALLALLEATTGVAPRVFGKPEAAMFEEALRLLGTDAAHTIMVGDRHETDIVGAARAGLKTIAVTTGASSREALTHCQPPPDWILPSVQEVLEALQAARR